MRIAFEISEEQATIALMYELGLGEKIGSKKAFKGALKQYFRLNGLQCQDDHDFENEDYRAEATELVNRYFK